MNLSRLERWLLSNQLEILEALYPEKAADYQEVREAIEHGYELHLDDFAQHIDEDAMTREECVLVIDILDMYSTLQQSYKSLGDNTGIDAAHLQFYGFDGNRETKYMFYARYFCKLDGGRFRSLQRSADFNSHVPSLDRYQRMVQAWKQSADRSLLSKEDMIRILQNDG